MRLWPRSLVGQTTLVLLAGVLLSNLIALVVFMVVHTLELSSARGQQLAAHVALASEILESAPVPQRRRLQKSFRAPGMRLSWSMKPLVIEKGDSWWLRRVSNTLVGELDIDDPTRLRLGLRRPGEPDLGQISAQVLQTYHERWLARHGGRNMTRGARAPLILGALRLKDGSWLNFVTAAAPPPRFWSTPYFAFVAASTLIVLIVALWAVRRAIRPLTVLAAAAERLGVDLNAPPVQDRGPYEVGQAARAFNRMQDRLQRFVRDRTLMLAAISHDLRTPITRLRLRAELLADTEDRRKSLADLEEMQAMLSATLAFSRDDATEEMAQTIDIAVLLQNVCEEWSDLGALVTFTVPDHFTFFGRPRSLKRAFSNLVENAVRYGKEAEVTMNSLDEAVVISTNDCGPGIPEDELEAVFQPFYRIESSRSRESGGIGLGLAVVRSVIALHGGHVVLKNREEGGLCAEVWLPCVTTK